MKPLLILALLLPLTSHATDCTKHPIYCSIVANKPSIDREYAMKLSNYIYKSTSKYDVPADIYTAILMQESRYVNSATNGTTGLDPITLEEVRVLQDIGISQINFRTAKRYAFDIPRIMVDVEYAVDCGAKVLGDFHDRFIDKEPELWYSYYNSPTPKHRRRYEKLVGRYLNE